MSLVTSAATGFMGSLHVLVARIGTMNRGGFVAQAFEPAGSGDFPVDRSWSTGLESPVNPQAGKPALQAGSWKGQARGWPNNCPLRWQSASETTSLQGLLDRHLPQFRLVKFIPVVQVVQVHRARI